MSFFVFNVNREPFTDNRCEQRSPTPSTGTPTAGN